MGQCQSSCCCHVPEHPKAGEFPPEKTKAVKSDPVIQPTHSNSSEDYDDFEETPRSITDTVSGSLQSSDTPSPETTKSSNSTDTKETAEQSGIADEKGVKKQTTPRRRSRSRPSAKATTVETPPLDLMSPGTQAGAFPKFTPLVTLRNSCQDAVIPEEDDPEAPSDEEDAFVQVQIQRRLDEPHFRHERAKVLSGVIVSPQSIRVQELEPHLGTQESVHPAAYAHFMKLRLQADVATKQCQQRKKVHKVEGELQDVLEYRQRWNEFQAIQNAVGQQPQPQPSEVAAESDSAVNKKKKKNKKKKRKARSRKKKENEELVEDDDDASFDLKDSGSWYFDFQNHEFESDVSINVTTDDDTGSQASLSLLSETSMEAQRRLFAEKARQRKLGIKTNIFSPADSTTAATPNNGGGSSSNLSVKVPQQDYGPQRKISPREGSVTSGTGPPTVTDYGPQRTRSDSIGSFPSRMRKDNMAGLEVQCDERSMVSELGDDYSLATSVFSGSYQRQNNDYGVQRRRRRGGDAQDVRNRVDPRFEETLRAVQSGPSLSARLDRIEEALAATPSRKKKSQEEEGDSVAQTPTISNSRSFTTAENCSKPLLIIKGLIPANAILSDSNEEEAPSSASSTNTNDNVCLSIEGNDAEGDNETAKVEEAMPGSTESTPKTTKAMREVETSKNSEEPLIHSSAYMMDNVEGSDEPEDAFIASLTSNSIPGSDSPLVESKQSSPELSSLLSLKKSTEKQCERVEQKTDVFCEDDNRSSAFSADGSSSTALENSSTLTRNLDKCKPSGVKRMSPPRQKNMAERARILSNLVYNYQTNNTTHNESLPVKGSADSPASNPVTPANSSLSKVHNDRVQQEKKERTSSGNRNARPPDVLGVSKEEFLRWSEENAFDKVKRIEKMIFGETHLERNEDRREDCSEQDLDESNDVQDSPRIDQVAQQYMDSCRDGANLDDDSTDGRALSTASSCTDFSDIMKMASEAMLDSDSDNDDDEDDFDMLAHLDDENLQHHDSRTRKVLSLDELRGDSQGTDIAQTSLLLAEKVEARVQDVLSKYRSADVRGPSPRNQLAVNGIGQLDVHAPHDER